MPNASEPLVLAVSVVALAVAVATWRAHRAARAESDGLREQLRVLTRRVHRAERAAKDAADQAQSTAALLMDEADGAEPATEPDASGPSDAGPRGPRTVH